jgi:hypothetical protein
MSMSVPGEPPEHSEGSSGGGLDRPDGGPNVGVGLPSRVQVHPALGVKSALDRCPFKYPNTHTGLLARA